MAELISAEESRRIAEKALQDGNEKLFQRILQDIKNARELGNTSCSRIADNNRLTDFRKEELESAGYEVIYKFHHYEIYW